MRLKREDIRLGMFIIIVGAGTRIPTVGQLGFQQRLEIETATTPEGCGSYWNIRT
jgi:NAD-dependent DNA ligase